MLGPRLPGQEEDPEFRAAFTAGLDAMAEIGGNQFQRAARAKRALEHFDRAVDLIGRLPASNRLRAEFFIAVRRAEVHGHLADQETHLPERDRLRRLTVDTALAARQWGVDRGVYEATYYRSVLLILLSRNMDELEFAALLAESVGEGESDGDYLRGDDSQELLTQWMGTDTSYKWYLRLLRAQVQLTQQPAWAVIELRELGVALDQQGAAMAGLRDECYSRLAWHFIELRDFERAQVFLDVLNPEDSRYPRALIDYKRGEFLFASQEAEVLCREDPGDPKNFLLLANALEGRGLEARDLGEASEADRLYKLALRSYGDAEATYRRSTLERRDLRVLVGALNGIGDCHLGLGDLDSAEQAYVRTKTELEAGVDLWTTRAELAETLKDLGRLAERRGDSTEALGHFDAALRQVESVRAEIPLDALGIAWLEPSLTEAVDGVLRLGLDGEVSGPTVLATVDRMKARGLLDWMSNPPSPQRIDSYRASLRALTRADSAAETKTSSLTLERLRSSAQSQREQVPTLSETALSELLESHPESVFLSYWTGKSQDRQRYYLVAAWERRGFSVYDLGSAIDGRSLYRSAVEAVAGDDGSDPWTVLDSVSSFFVPSEVSSWIAASDQVVVCLDPDVGGLPFEALRIRGRPVGVSKVVYRAPSLTVWAQLQSRRSAGSSEGRALILDSVELPDVDRDLHKLSELTYSSAEGDGVASSYRASTRLQTQDATFAGLSQALGDVGSHGLLHISCHAVNHARIPSASLLMLSDGPLDMGALATLPMRDMTVVFSSCMSAGSARAGGEGIKGLLWGPFGAGARSVVASHWQMNQQSTMDLMGQFHHHLAAGVGEGEAMRRARQTLAAASNYAHPHYWAGFGVYAAPAGEPSPWIPGGTWPYLLMLVGAGVLVILGLRRR